MSQISARLISHASAIIEVDGVRILTDPWLFGTAFNDSWKLLTEAADLNAYLDGVDYLWISHEHPDHFHIPTLKSLPADFKKRVTVLFQESSDHEKMVGALTGMLGFSSVKLLPHRKWVSLEQGVEVLCYQSRHLDSALAVRGATGTVLNINDCDMNEHDFKLLREDLGRVDLLLNQFSIAGFDGVEANLPGAASMILDDVVQAHRELGARTTVPFASFVYFSTSDNRLINKYANSPNDLAARFEKEGLALAVLLPGEAYTLGEPHDNAHALAEYARIYATIDDLPYDTAPSIAFDELARSFARSRKAMRHVHGQLGLMLLKPVVVAIPDLGCSVLMSYRDDRFELTDEPPAVEIHSQPFHFMLANNFGLQTLGVSGRLRLIADSGNWFRHRALMGMLNAGIGLAPRKLFSPRQMAFFWSRRADLYHQTRHTAGRVLGGIAGQANKPAASA